MGCPDIYYRQALQTACHSRLITLKNSKLAKQYAEEQDIDKLEKMIEELREDTPDFYYDMGMAAGVVYQDACDNDGCDGFNACLGGIYMFESLIKGDDED